MKDKLIKLLNNSYSPYSKFRVAAIVVSKNEKLFYGVNVENISYGSSICAERSAILNAVSHGAKRGDFKTLYIMSDNDEICMPCFACRQVIREFFENDSNIVCMSKNGNSIKYSVNELCPFPFESEELK